MKKFKFIDIIIGLVIIVFIALAVIKLVFINTKEANNLENSSVEVEYEAFVDKIRMATINALHEGDLVFDDKTGACIGKIKSFEYRELTYDMPDGNGGFIKSVYPNYYQLNIILIGNLIEKEEGYFAEGVAELKVNSEMDVSTKYLKPVIKITKINM